jgi:hypothetical protein
MTSKRTLAIVRPVSEHYVARRRKKGQKAYLANLRVTGNRTLAAEAAKVHRATPYTWAREDPEFAKEVEEALEVSCDMLEAEVRRRAVEGTEELTGWYMGKPGGTVRRYSDLLLLALLRAHRPERWREKHSHEVTGKNGAPLVTPSKIEIVLVRPNHEGEGVEWGEGEETPNGHRLTENGLDLARLDGTPHRAPRGKPDGA